MNRQFSGKARQGTRMPRLKHIIGLASLVIFVGYFAVWRGYLLMAEHYGVLWGVLAASVAGLGVAVIAVVGVVVIQTLRKMEGGDGPEKKPPERR